MPSTTPGHTLLSRLRRAPAADWVRRHPRRLPPQAARSTRRPQGRRPLSLATATVALALTLTFAAVPLSAQTVEDRLQGFDQWVESVMAEWKVPGLGVAIVEDGEIVFAKGYGWRNVEQELPVTPDTLFAIGSNTKSFTATLLAMQVDEGALAWDTPIRTVLPEFRLHDPVATGQMTAVDLLSHRSGLPRHDLFWYATGKSRTELLAGLHHLEPSASFRSRYQYQNLMFLTAGVVAERIGGKSWEELVEERIFRPLGMERANFSVVQMQQDDDFSYGYGAEQEIERVQRVPFRNIDAHRARRRDQHVGPGTRPLRAVPSRLREGRRYAAPQGGLGEAHAATSDGDDRPAPAEIAGRPGSQRSHLRIGPHGGRLPRPQARQPRRRHRRFHLRDAVVARRADRSHRTLQHVTHGTVPALVVRNAFDRMLGLEPIDWAARARKREAEAKQEAEEAKKADLAAAAPDTSPTHPLADYAGDYEHPGYGKASVRVHEDGLILEVVGIEFPLKHYHYDLFIVPYDLPASAGAAGFGGVKVRFDYDDAGAINVVSVPLEPAVSPIRFVRASDWPPGRTMQGRAPTRFAVMTAAIGEVLQQTLALPKPLSLAFALICVGFLSWRGSSFIEKAKTWGSAALYLGYCAFALLALTAPVEAAAAHPPAAVPDVSPLDVVISAAFYVAYNVAVVPAVLFCLHRQTRRTETFASGAIAGVAMTVPFALTLACLRRFPQASVMDAEVPWLPMITTAADGRAGGPALWIAVFGWSPAGR